MTFRVNENGRAFPYSLPELFYFKMMMVRLDSAILPVLVISWRLVFAVIPPHPDHSNWQSVHEVRRRLNVTYGYDPQYLDPEYCRHLPVEQCRAEDEGLGNAIATRRLAANTGDVKVLVLLCRFRDHIDVELPTKEYFEELFNGNQTSEINKIGSIKEWLYYNSVGKYRVTFEVHDWFTLPFAEAHYAGGASGLRGAEIMQEVFKPKLDELYNSGYDFSSLDSKGWGTLDHLVAIHSGYGAELGDPNPNKPELAGCVPPATDRIWSQGIGFTASGWQSFDFAYQVSPFILAGAFDPVVCQNKPANMAIITHEYMHGLGLIDVYDQDRDEERIFIGGVGRFCIMAAVYGWNRDLAVPGHLSPFGRTNAGWIDPFEIVEDGTYPIQASEFSNQVYIIKRNFPDQEFLYIENRQQVKWDQDWPSSGIVIYHVDLLAPRQQQRGYPKHPNFPAEHYQVSVVQRDGKFDIEAGANPGDVNDFWQKDMILKSDCEVWPNTCSYQGGVLETTGIEITINTDPGFIMSFSVKGLNQGKALQFSDPRFSSTQEQPDPDRVGSVLSWVVGVLTGVAALVGFLLVLL